MKTFVIAVLAALALQVMASSTPEEMYGMYDKDGKYREMSAKVEQMKHKADEARAEENGRKMRILLVSLFIGFVPVVAVGGKVIRKQTWKTNSSGTAQALVMAFAGGAVLFAFNYGWLYMKLFQEEIFKLILSLVFILLLIALGFYLARKRK